MSARDLVFGESPSEPTAARPYRGTEGQIDRLSIIFFQLRADGSPDLDKPRLIAAQTQYHASVGTLISRAGEPAADEEIWQACEAARQRYATLVVRYPTDPQGRARQDPAGISILVWDYGESTQRKLHELSAQQIALGRNLGAVDLQIRCTNARKQYLDIAVAGPAAWRTNPTAQQRLLDRAVALYDTVRVGRDLADAEIRRALGLSPLVDAVDDFPADLINLV